jgi:hypothetical protein
MATNDQDNRGVPTHWVALIMQIDSHIPVVSLGMAVVRLNAQRQYKTGSSGLGGPNSETYFVAAATAGATRQSSAVASAIWSMQTKPMISPAALRSNVNAPGCRRIQCRMMSADAGPCSR